MSPNAMSRIRNDRSAAWVVHIHIHARSHPSKGENRTRKTGSRNLVNNINISSQRMS
jgi:hypothetical protein